MMDRSGGWWYRLAASPLSAIVRHSEHSPSLDVSDSKTEYGTRFSRVQLHITLDTIRNTMAMNR